MVDYLFRRIALDHLSQDKCAELGIYSAEERAATVAATDYGQVDVEGLRSSVGTGPVADLEEVAGRDAGTRRGGLHLGAAGDGDGSGHRRPALLHLRDEDAPGRQLLRM